MVMKLNEANVLKVRLHKIFLERQMEPLKVMVAGDWHISPIISEKQFDDIKEAVVQADPDVIILQGDLVDSPVELRRETSLKKLVRELKLCAAVAPTILVLGGHDYITPTKPPKIMLESSLHLWEKVCKRCGVQLLVNEWCEPVPGLKIFGQFQDPRCIVQENRDGEMKYKDSPKGFLENLQDAEDEIKSGLDEKSVLWFAAHAPLLNKEVIEQLRPFDVASFGHTHGGAVPLGLDEVFDRLHLHRGLISPDYLPLPRRARGVMPISDSTMLVINPGMVATHFCDPKFFQNLNFLKAAEISIIELGQSDSLDEQQTDPADDKKAEESRQSKPEKQLIQEKATPARPSESASAKSTRTTSAKKDKAPKNIAKSRMPKFGKRRKKGESVESNLEEYF